ncbi:PREDICTED: uncharacterized protein LOC104816719 [Tarenaya hassleriana]|uniref:uncharacterized protein LOC104816719 n=1 Tax=Tarenaya hassleriana TaxID=28532 RepID=UPI00053C58D8|nr:PREDICTED: uncharacterized protein LOC104816719 [Tarenaya hassleriana]
MNEGTSSHGASPTLPEILASAERRLRPRLDPNHSPGFIWFDRNNEVITIVVSIFQSNFKGPWRSLIRVPPSDLHRWFGAFAQAYYWDEAIHDQVYAAWRLVVRDRLKDNIYRVKCRCVRPPWMSTAIYDQLVAHWDSEEGTEKSQIFSNNRRSRPEIECAPRPTLQDRDHSLESPMR